MACLSSGMPGPGGYWLPRPSRMASAAARAIWGGPSRSGKPWPRLIDPVATARADISAKIVVPRPSRRRLSGGVVVTLFIMPCWLGGPNKVQSMRVALGQIPVSSRPAVNAERVQTAMREAAEQGADLAVFPEATQIRFGSDLRAAAEPLDGPFGSGLAVAAKETGVALVAGVFEPAPDGRVYNTAVVFDDRGELVASYRKLHLFDAFGHRESDQVAPGSAPDLDALARVLAGLETRHYVR